MFERISPVIALALVGALAACSKEPPPPQRPAPMVSVLEIKPQTIPIMPTFVAQTESSQQVDIVARVSGFLDKIAYQEGDLVKEGQVLFQLDPKPFEAQLEAAKGELQAQEARLPRARFDNGYAGYLEVLYAKNELFGAELPAVRTQVDRYGQLVSVYKSMGGGWVNEAGKLAPQPQGMAEAASDRAAR